MDSPTGFASLGLYYLEPSIKQRLVLKEKINRILNRVVPCDITRLLLLDAKNRVPPSKPLGDLVLCELSAAEVRRFAQSPSNDLRIQLADLIESQEARCIAVLDNNVLAGYTWFANGTVDPMHNCGGGPFKGIGLRLPAQLHFLFKAFVLPDYRGLSLNRWIFCYAAELFSNEGSSQIITTTDWSNDAFFNSATAGGFEQIGIEAEVLVFGKHRYYLPKLEQYGVSLFGWRDA